MSGGDDGGGDGTKTAVTVLDVCSGRTDHLNLKQVVSGYELQ